MAVGPVGFSVEQQELLWGMWRGGESLRGIGRSLGVSMPRVQRFLRLSGGIRPSPQRRRKGHLGAGEREEISRGIAAGLSGRVIAARLNRSPSTVAREIARNGGRDAYRAVVADAAAYDRASRPKPSKLATNEELRRRGAVYDPANVVLDLAVTLALGGDCLADIGVLRAEPGVYGSVASDPTVSRAIATLAADAPVALAAIDTARASARVRVWAVAGRDAPNHDASAAAPLVIDLDATLVTSHSEKQAAAPTFKRGFGFHPLCAFVDHGAAGTGKMIAVALRPGNAGSNTAVDHIAVTQAALAQLPAHRAGRRPGRRVLIRTDGAGSSHAFLDWLTRQRLSYSVGFGLPNNTAELLALMDESVWTPAYNSDGQVREGAWVAELTGMLTLGGWPAGMRVIVRKERPHPGAQLRITDADGLRVTAFATNTTRGQLPDLELRHRRRARAEDRIRCAKDTGLRNLPLHSFAQNQLWCAIVTLAAEITAWMQLLALTSTNDSSGARRWEPKRLRLRLFTIAAALTRHSRQVVLTLNQKQPWATLAHEAVTALRALPAPG